jgi:hypothetical protein
VIGNAKYPDNDVAMNDVTNDAQDVADELKRDGFDVDRGVNLTGDGMRQALERFYARIQPGSIALLFFDGFGIQSARQTYLLPVDAQIWMEADVVHDGFNIETILGEMNGRGASVKVALVEAARRNPFERRFRRYSAGLAPAVTPGNTLVLYSAALGSVIGSVRADHGLFALRDCDRALQLKPDNADALDSRGLVNLELGRYPEAISDYSASLEKNPHSVSSMFGRGLALKPPAATAPPTSTRRGRWITPSPANSRATASTSASREP